MQKIITLVMLVAGVVLVVYGITATQSLSSSFSRLFSGAPTDKASWMLISGGVLILLGMAGWFRGSKASL